MAMTLRLTPEDDARLAKLAEMDGVSKHEAAVRAITDAAARREHRTLVDLYSSEILVEDAELLERLSQ